MGMNGRRKAEEKFSWDKVAKQVEEYYFEIIEKYER
jgi:glycosyltransferase involved in cell wall biosynthesis